MKLDREIFRMSLKFFSQFRFLPVRLQVYCVNVNINFPILASIYDQVELHYLIGGDILFSSCLSIAKSLYIHFKREFLKTFKCLLKLKCLLPYEDWHIAIVVRLTYF